MTTGANVGLATATDFPNLSQDDQLAATALADHGLNVTPVIWNDPATGWQLYDMVIIRSCWDYHRQPAAFRSWIESLEALDIALWNQPDLVRWNLDKIYLTELAAANIPTVPTVIIDQESSHRLERVLREQGWEEAVLKPSVAATAYQTAQVSLETVEADQALLDQILSHADALVQPFVPTIKDAGEWSLVFFDGEFSHSVKKYAKADDFRVQSDFGGTIQSEAAPSSLVTQAERLIQFLDQRVLYARVDGLEIAGEFMLMELELIDPELFFTYSSSAVKHFAEAVVEYLENDRKSRKS